MFTHTLGVTLDGIDGRLVTVEVDVHPGLPQFNIVGLPDSSVRESKDRVRSAIINSGFEFPLQRITVNLAPADCKKEGSCLDLAIASGILIATGQILAPNEPLAIIGELSLDGSTRPVVGVLPLTLAAIHAGIHKLAVSIDSAAELNMFQPYTASIDILPVHSLAQLASYLKGETSISAHIFSKLPSKNTDSYMPDFKDVHGQVIAKRALEIAAAGGHNLLFIGPPGCGKSMLAIRMQSILPELTSDQALEVNKLYSVVHAKNKQHQPIHHRPFRSPHHSISPAGLVGGGIPPHPGEISLAHHGVLFLDELAEFSKTTLDLLRQPLENGSITLSRARYQYTLPARFQLLAAMNPCPCGYYDSKLPCKCSHNQITRYQSRISGPLLDRFHMYVWMEQEPHLPSPHTSDTNYISSSTIRERTQIAFQKQIKRNLDQQTNASTGPHSVDSWLIDKDALDLWQQTSIIRKLSTRSHEQVIRVARTIADLACRDKIEMMDIAESLQYADRSSLQLLK